MVTVQRKKLFQKTKHERFVFHDEDGVLTLGRGLRRSFFWNALHSVLFSGGNDREVQKESCTVHRLTLYSNKTIVVFHNGISHGEAQSGSLAGLLGGEEGLEDPALNVFVHPRTGISELDGHVLLCCRIDRLFQVSAINDTGLDHKRATVRHRVAGIYAKIEQHLSYLVRIRHDRRKPGG